MALPPNYLFVNPKDGRLVSQSYLQVPGGTSTVPSISFIDSANSGLSCDASGVVSIISAGSQKVTVGSTTTINSPISLTDALSFPLGTAAAPSLYPGTDTNTGIYSPGADQVAISTGGTGRLFVDASGRVGIGTSSPSALLDVAGATNPGIQITNSATDSASIVYETAANALNVSAYNPSSGSYRGVRIRGSSITLQTTASASLSTAVTIDSSQRVGIGTTSPSNLFTVSGTASVAKFVSSGGDVSLAFQNSTSNAGYISYAADNLTFWTNNTERARIDSSGRLLVGTSTQKGLLTLGSGSHYSVVDPGATIKKVDYTSAMGSESFFSWRTWRSGKNYAAGVSGVATIAVPSPSLLRVKIMATADGVGVRNYAYEAYVLATPASVYTIDVIKQTTLLTGGSSPAMSGSNLVFTCPAAASNQSLIYVEVEQVSSQSDTTITFS